MAMNIDYNRGVLIRSHPALQMDIYMYHDSPGVYLNGYGTEIAEALAAEAGYPVEVYSKEKERRRRVAQATEAIERELNAAAPQRKVVREQGGFRMVDMGLDRFQIEDPNGAVLHKDFLTKALADKLLNSLAPVVAGSTDTKKGS